MRPFVTNVVWLRRWLADAFMHNPMVSASGLFIFHFLSTDTVAKKKKMGSGGRHCIIEGSQDSGVTSNEVAWVIISEVGKKEKNVSNDCFKGANDGNRGI